MRTRREVKNAQMREMERVENNISKIQTKTMFDGVTVYAYNGRLYKTYGEAVAVAQH